METIGERVRFDDMPERIRALPKDHRGYPVPYFVAWPNGKPDHRIMDRAKLWPAMEKKLCWICGQRLGAYLAFPIGPMCVINRNISEPPSHLDCARFAVKACPFLSIPEKARREKHLPDDIKAPAGIGLKRNPGVTAIWICKEYRSQLLPNGLLFQLGEPIGVEWYCEGRPASREEVEASIEGGLPSLLALAKADGPVALLRLRQMLHVARGLLPAK